MRDIIGANGEIVARIDSSGYVTLGPDPGPIVGLAASTGEIYDDEAGVHLVGRVSGDGQINNADYQPSGRVDSWGRVFDNIGCQLGKVEKPIDGGVLVFLTLPPQATTAAPQADLKENALMSEAMELADEFNRPRVRKEYKPLTDRDLFIEAVPRKPEDKNGPRRRR